MAGHDLTRAAADFAVGLSPEEQTLWLSDEESLSQALLLQLQFDKKAEDERLARKLQQEINDAEVAKRARELEDEAMACAMQSRLDDERKSMLEKSAKEGEEFARQLVQAEDVARRDEQIKSLNLANELYYADQPSYLSIAQLEPSMKKKILQKLVAEKPKVRTQSVQSGIHDEQMSPEELEVEICTEVTSTFTLEEIHSLLQSKSFDTDGNDVIVEFATRLAVYRKNPDLRERLVLAQRQLCASKDGFKNDVPHFDMHGLRIFAARKRVYAMIRLARKYRWPRICIVTGVGHRTGNSTMRTSTSAVLSSLLDKPHGSSRMIMSFEYDGAGKFIIKVNTRDFYT